MSRLIHVLKNPAIQWIGRLAFFGASMVDCGSAPPRLAQLSLSITGDGCVSTTALNYGCDGGTCFAGGCNPGTVGEAY
jgi:hypothetical protein